jgi:hypothetical protein
VGTAFTYQGHLELDGSPVSDTCRLIFELYDQEGNGGERLGDAIEAEVEVIHGNFSLPLDFGRVVFNGEARYLQITVDCELGSDILSPRQAITAVPYALSLRPGATIVGSDTVLTLVSDNTVGVYGLHSGSRGTQPGVLGETRSTSVNAAGVLGRATASSGTTYGVHGVSASHDGTGVYGLHSATTGSEPGVRGETRSTDNDAVGVLGYVAAAAVDVKVPDNSAGVRGINEGHRGYGVWGSHNGIGTGVMGSSESGNGVYGYATGTSGTNYGVYGQSLSSDGIGVYGLHSALGGAGPGVLGETRSIEANAAGVLGRAVSDSAVAAAGVRGINEATGLGGYGVWGSHNGYGWGVYGSATSGTGVVAQSGSGNLIEAYSVSDREFYVTNDGDVWADGAFNSPAADFAEMLSAVAGLGPGDVLVVGPGGVLTRSTRAYQPTVVGVYSTQPGFVGGFDKDADLNDKIPLAVVGVVPVKASAENGAIQPGDLLVAASTPGHAMRCEGAERCFGRTIGKALEALDDGTGLIQMLVVLQ